MNIKLIKILVAIFILIATTMFAQTYNEEDKSDLRSFLRQGENYIKLGLTELDTLTWDTSDVWLHKLYDLHWLPNDSEQQRIHIVGFSSYELEGIIKLNSPLLVTLNCSENNLSAIDVSDNIALTYLDCSENNLSVLDISRNTNLSELYCHHNNISLLNISNNIDLKELYCYQNNLSNLDISNNSGLLVIDCSNNNLSNLDVSSNLDLYDLVCSNNNLTVLNIDSNLKLENLQCDNNGLNILDVSNNIELSILNCGDNNLNVLDVSNNLALLKFNCGGNNLELIDISDNLELIAFGCAGNKLNRLDISSNTELEYLECYDNNLKISTLPIATFEDGYKYAPQKIIDDGIITYTHTVDLSSEYIINGDTTYYEWFDIMIGLVENIVSQPINTNGIFTLSLIHKDKRLRCKMRNEQFPELELIYEIDMK